jgi:hypothetical protein
MKVTITDKCDRCKREAPKEVDSADIPKLEAAAEKREKAQEAIANSFTELKATYGDAVPDLVVVYRGKVQTIGKVCDAFCDKTVKNQIAAMFKDMDVSKRKPKAKKSDQPKDDKKDAKGGKTKKAGSGVEDKAAGTPAS